MAPHHWSLLAVVRVPVMAAALAPAVLHKLTAATAAAAVLALVGAAAAAATEVAVVVAAQVAAAADIAVMAHRTHTAPPGAALSSMAKGGKAVVKPSAAAGATVGVGV